MDFRLRNVSVLLALFLASSSAHALKYDQFFPKECPVLTLDSENLIRDSKNLTKIAEKRAKLYTSIKKYQDMADSGLLLEQYFRQRGLKTSVRTLASSDIEGVYNASRSDVYNMTMSFMEARVYNAKIESMKASLGSMEKVIEADPKLVAAYRDLIVYMTDHLPDYTIITQFLRKATGQLKNEKGELISYKKVLIDEWIRHESWLAEMKGERLDVTDELLQKAEVATKDKAEHYEEVSRAVLKKLSPDASGGLPANYRKSYPSSLRTINDEEGKQIDVFSRIPTYEEIRILIDQSEMDRVLYLLTKQDRYQKIAFWSMFRPTKLFNAAVQLVARKVIPRSKWASMDAFVYSLENLEVIYAHDAAIGGVLDFRGTLVEKGYELLARNGNKDNAMLVRFATRDDLAWEWEMLKLAAEKASPPNTRLLNKMKFAEDIAVKLDGSNGSIASAKRRMMQKAVDLVIVGVPTVIGAGHLMFGEAEIKPREIENNDDPTPETSPEPNAEEEKNKNEPDPNEKKTKKEKPEEKKPEEKKDNAYLNSGKRNEEVRIQYVKNPDPIVLSRVKARFQKRPPKVQLTIADEIALNEALEAMDEIKGEFTRSWAKSGNSFSSASKATPKKQNRSVANHE